MKKILGLLIIQQFIIGNSFAEVAYTDVAKVKLRGVIEKKVDVKMPSAYLRVPGDKNLFVVCSKGSILVAGLQTREEYYGKGPFSDHGLELFPSGEGLQSIMQTTFDNCKELFNYIENKYLVMEINKIENTIKFIEDSD